MIKPLGEGEQYVRKPILYEFQNRPLYGTGIIKGMKFYLSVTTRQLLKTMNVGRFAVRLTVKIEDPPYIF